MSASMTISLTEDTDEFGYVHVDFDIEGFDVETAQTNSDLPAALLLGAKMVELSHNLAGPAERAASKMMGQAH